MKDTHKYELVIWTEKGGGGGLPLPSFLPFYLRLVSLRDNGYACVPVQHTAGALSQKFSNYGIFQEVGVFHNVEMI